jgi:Sulfotransferase family
MVWRMIGSSPDVIMTTKEWHDGVFGRRTLQRKLVLAIFRSFGIESFEPLRRYAFAKTLQMLSPIDLVAKADARTCVVKLMDYHIVFSEMIRRSFRLATFVNLTRHPYGQCESLMRSGLSLESACRWYNDVAHLMTDHVQAEAIAVRFEDVIASPVETCDALYKSLGVRWSDDRRFMFKDKPYGAHRTANVGVPDGELLRIGGEDWRKYIDPSVLTYAIDRLSDKERTAIWESTGAAAGRLGYAGDGSG